MNDRVLRYWHGKINTAVAELFKENNGAIALHREERIQSKVLKHDPDMRECPALAWNRLEEILRHLQIQRRILTDGRTLFHQHQLPHLDAAERVDGTIAPTMPVFSGR